MLHSPGGCLNVSSRWCTVRMTLWRAEKRCTVQHVEPLEIPVVFLKSVSVCLLLLKLLFDQFPLLSLFHSEIIISPICVVLPSLPRTWDPDGTIIFPKVLMWMVCLLLEGVVAVLQSICRDMSFCTNFIYCACPSSWSHSSLDNWLDSHFFPVSNLGTTVLSSCVSISYPSFLILLATLAPMQVHLKWQRHSTSFGYCGLSSVMLFSACFMRAILS